MSTCPIFGKAFRCLKYVQSLILYTVKSDVVQILVRLFSPKLRSDIASLAWGDPSVIVDLLSGTGSGLLSFSRLFPDAEIVAVDVDRKVLEFIGERALRSGFRNVRTVCADARELPFPAGFADVVTISFGLHENRRIDRGLILGEALRILKPGKKVIVLDYERPGGFLSSRSLVLFMRLFEPRHAMEILGGNLESEIERAGFRIIDSFMPAPFARVVVAVKPDLQPVDYQHGED